MFVGGPIGSDQSVAFAKPCLSVGQSDWTNPWISSSSVCRWANRIGPIGGFRQVAFIGGQIGLDQSVAFVTLRLSVGQSGWTNRWLSSSRGCWWATRVGPIGGFRLVALVGGPIGLDQSVALVKLRLSVGQSGWTSRLISSSRDCRWANRVGPIGGFRHGSVCRWANRVGPILL